MMGNKKFFVRNPSKSRDKFEIDHDRMISICYHDIFDYPLTNKDLHRWKLGKKASNEYADMNVKTQHLKGYYFVEGRKDLVEKKEEKKKYFHKKYQMARKYGNIIALNPFVKLVALTGALAMKNASRNSDVDILIITRKNSLWIARLTVWIILKIISAPLRKPKNKNEKDMLCLNIWLDENGTTWPKNERNIYTAHEILHVVPLYDKSSTFSKFINNNLWAGEYWQLNKKKYNNKNILYRKSFFSITFPEKLLTLINLLLYKVQFQYMRNKISRETVTPTRALFHPNDMSEYVLKKLEGYSA